MKKNLLAIVVIFSLVGCSAKYIGELVNERFDNKKLDYIIDSVVSLDKEIIMDRLITITESQGTWKLEKRTENKLIFTIPKINMKQVYYDDTGIFNRYLLKVAIENDWRMVIENSIHEAYDDNWRIYTNYYMENKEHNIFYFNMKKNQPELYMYYTNLDMMLESPNYEKLIKKIEQK